MQRQPVHRYARARPGGGPSRSAATRYNVSYRPLAGGVARGAAGTRAEFAVALPPALTVIAQLLLVMVAGIMGAALAAPLAAVMVVMVVMLYVQDVLGRRDIGPEPNDTPTLPA